MKPTGLSLLAAALLLGACGGESAEEPPVDDTVEELSDALDKVAEVEQQVLEQKDRLDRALDESGGKGHEEAPGN